MPAVSYQLADNRGAFVKSTNSARNSAVGNSGLGGIRLYAECLGFSPMGPVLEAIRTHWYGVADCYADWSDRFGTEDPVSRHYRLSATNYYNPPAATSTDGYLYEQISGSPTNKPFSAPIYEQEIVSESEVITKYGSAFDEVYRLRVVLTDRRDYDDMFDRLNSDLNPLTAFPAVWQVTATGLDGPRAGVGGDTRAELELRYQASTIRPIGGVTLAPGFTPYLRATGSRTKRRILWPSSTVEYSFTVQANTAYNVTTRSEPGPVEILHPIPIDDSTHEGMTPGQLNTAGSSRLLYFGKRIVPPDSAPS